MKKDKVLFGVYADVKGFWTRPTAKDLLWVGKRILYRYKFASGGWSGIHEGVVSEFSPSKTYVRIRYDWYLPEDIRVVEVLSES